MNIKLFFTLTSFFIISTCLLAQKDPNKAFKPVFNPQGLVEPDDFYALEDAPVLPIEDYSEWLVGVGVVMITSAAFRERKRVID